MSNNSNNSNKIVTIEYLEKYNKSLCSEIVKVTNDIVLNAPQTASGCEFISQNNDGKLTLHYKQVDETALPILESETNNGNTTIELKGYVVATGNITVNGTSNLKDVAFQNVPTVSGEANVTSTLNLGITGEITSKSDASATIQNGVIDGFTLQNCTGAGGVEEYIITADINPEGTDIFNKYKVSPGDISLDTIEDALEAGKKLKLIVKDKVNEGNIDRTIELNSFTGLNLAQGTIWTIEGKPIKTAAYIFSESNDFYEQDNSFIIADISDYEGLQCIPYKLSEYCDVEILLAETDVNLLNNTNQFESASITINTITTEYDGSDFKLAGLAIYNAINNGMTVRVHIKNDGFYTRAGGPIYDLYTQDCRYIYDCVNDGGTIIIKYSAVYDGNTSPITVKDYFIAIPFIIS